MAALVEMLVQSHRPSTLRLLGGLPTSKIRKLRKNEPSNRPSHQIKQDIEMNSEMPGDNLRCFGGGRVRGIAGRGNILISFVWSPRDERCQVVAALLRFERQHAWLRGLREDQQGSGFFVPNPKISEKQTEFSMRGGSSGKADDDIIDYFIEAPNHLRQSRLAGLDSSGSEKLCKFHTEKTTTATINNKQSEDKGKQGNSWEKSAEDSAEDSSESIVVTKLVLAAGLDFPCVVPLCDDLISDYLCEEQLRTIIK